MVILYLFIPPVFEEFSAMSIMSRNFQTLCVLRKTFSLVYF